MKDFDCIKQIDNGSGYVCDCIYMPRAQKLCVASLDRSISYYEGFRNIFNMTGRVFCPSDLGLPISLSLCTSS